MNFFKNIQAYLTTLIPLSIFIFFTFQSNGQSAATLVKDIKAGSASSNPNNFTSIGNITYFKADDGTGSQLWKSDGTELGTVKIGPAIGNPLVYNGNVYYCAKNIQPDGYVSAILWKYNGITVEVIDTMRSNYYNILNVDLKIINASIAVDVIFQYNITSTSFDEYTSRFFSKGLKGTTDKIGVPLSSRYNGIWSNVEPYYINDTIAYVYTGNFTFGQSGGSSIYLKSKQDYVWRVPSRPSPAFTEIYPIGIINNEFIYISLRLGSIFGYVGNQYDPYYYLYKMNNNGDTTRLVQSPINVLKQPGGPFSLTNNKLVKPFNNKIYFITDDNKIWETNGTPTGTVVLSDGANPNLPSDFKDAIVASDGLYFWDKTATASRIWRIGTNGNIKLILSLPFDKDLDIKLMNLNNQIYQFSKTQTTPPNNPTSIYKIDGTNNSRQFIGTANGINYIDDNTASATPTDIFFSANDSTSTITSFKGQELWKMPLTPSVDACANDIILPYFGFCPQSSVKNITGDRDTSWYPLPTALDNCSTPSVVLKLTGVYSYTSTPTGNQVIIAKDSTARFEYTATDSKGNFTKCIFTVKILKPCITSSATFNTPCPRDTIISTSDACTRVSWTVPTATDNCGNVATVTQTQGSPSGSCFSTGVNNIEYKKQYGTDVCSFKITVNQVVNPCANDILAPTLQNCPQNISLITTSTSAIATWTAPTTTDNCTITPSLSSNYTSGSLFGLGSTTVIYTATDAKNNKSTCSFIVNVQQQITSNNDFCVNPTANVKGGTNSITVTGIKTSSAIIQIFNSAWSSVYNQQVSIDSVKIPNLPVGNYNVKVTVLGEGGKWPAVCSNIVNNIIVINGINPCDADTQAPVLSNCPTNISLTTSGTTAVATWQAPTAVDNCTATPLVSSNYNSGFTFPIGSTTVIYTAKDAKNNTSTCSFTVTVTTAINTCDADTQAPVFSNCPTNISLTTSGTTAVATWAAPTATDNCTATPSVSSNYNSGFAFPIGNTTVIYTAKDAKNNTSTCSFKVNITQQTASGDVCANPSANVKGGANLITISGIATSSAIVQIFNSAWSSVYNQQVSASSVTIPISIVGTYNVKVTVLGEGGKWPSLCSVIVNNVTVSNGGNPCDMDATPPVFSNCPTNINLISTGTSVIATWISPTATDNCTVTPSVSSNYNSGIAFPIGTTSVVYTAKDTKGNQATCSFNVSVALNSPYPKVVLKSSTHTISQNQKVCIGISVDSFINIVNYQFPILFNPAVLRFDSIIFNYPSFIEGGHSELTAIDALRGSLTFLNYAPVSTLPNNSKLFDLCFTSIGEANTSSDISFDNPQLFPTRFVRDGNYLLNTVSKIGRVTIQGTTPTTPDIALSIAATPNTYRQWTTNTFRITAKNNGSQAMNNIKVHFKYPNQTVKGGEVIPSVGTWTEYCSGGILCYEWSIPTLSTNATATLDVPLFILGATAPIIANTNLLTSTPTDGNTNNNVATVTLASAAPLSQMLAMPNRPKPSQFIPVVIQAISPNPTDGDVMIEIESIIEKEVRFDFYNTLGKVIKTEVRALNKGENRLAFEFWNYQNGIYFIQTNEGQGRGVPLKFVKL